MTKSLTYKDAGVDLDASQHTVSMITAHIFNKRDDRVINLQNGFAGLFRLDYEKGSLFRKNFRKPVMVACSDGVGTKVKIASMMKQYNTVGIDLVAMSINDLLVQGAEPCFFLDYIAVNQDNPQLINQLVSGISTGCDKAHCQLLGGETAEMPGLYRKGDFDLAGFAVGLVEEDKIISGNNVNPGDAVIGLPSNGLHSNGFSLVRHICFKKKKLRVTEYIDDLGKTLGEALMEPTRIYVDPIINLLNKYRVKKVIKAMAHITGGGLVGNIPRVIPEDLDVVIDRKWPIPPIFPFLQKLGKVSQKEMFRVFNMGIGYVLIVSPSFAHSIIAHLRQLGEKPTLLGKVKRGSGKIIIK